MQPAHLRHMCQRTTVLSLALALFELPVSAAQIGAQTDSVDQALSARQRTNLQAPMILQPFIRRTKDIRGYELVPSFHGTYKGADFTTNKFGMRDKEYSLTPAPGTYRIAFVGSSFTMGAGVPESLTHEALLENRLNREGPRTPRVRYEVLNFAVGGYGVLENVGVIENRIFNFKPNAVLLVIHPIERGRIINHLERMVEAQTPVEYPYLQAKLKEAGVQRGMQEPELRRRLARISKDLVRWSYARIVDACRNHGVRLLAIGFPLPENRRGADEELTELLAMAASAGIPTVSLAGVYAGHPLESFWLSDPQESHTTMDSHLNELGHRVVADRIYELLRDNDTRALQLGFSVHR